MLRKRKLRVVVAWGRTCRATHQDVDHLHGDLEEADTKMLLHALKATANSATELFIHTPDTDHDVLVPSLRRYPELCMKTSFVTGSGDNHRLIEVSRIVAFSAALNWRHYRLPRSGADFTGSFSRDGKLAC